MSSYQALLVSAPPIKQDWPRPTPSISGLLHPSSVCPVLFCPAFPAACPSYLALIVSFHSLPRLAPPFSPVHLSRLAQLRLLLSCLSSFLLITMFVHSLRNPVCSCFCSTPLFSNLLAPSIPPSTCSSTPLPHSLPSPFTCFIRSSLCLGVLLVTSLHALLPLSPPLSRLFLFLVSFLRHPTLSLVFLIFVSSLIAQPSLPGHLPGLAPPFSLVTHPSSVPVRPGMHGHCGCQATRTSDWPCHPWQVPALPGQTFPSTSQ